MKCDICNKELSWLFFIGKDNVCNNCMIKHTLFKELRLSDESRLRKALRAFDINCFNDLKNIKEHQLELLENGKIQEKSKQTVKYKKNKQSIIRTDAKEDTLDPMSEMDQFW